MLYFLPFLMSVAAAIPAEILIKVFDFQQRLHHSKCPLSFVNYEPSSSLVSSAEYPLHMGERPFEISSDSYQKWSPHCKTVVMSIDANDEAMGSSLPVFNYYILVGTTQNIKAAFQSVSMQKLRFKISVSTDEDSSTAIGLTVNALRNTHVRICTWKLDPWYADLTINGRVVPAGVHYNLIPMASKVYNFTYDLTIHPPKFHMYPNGTWVGVMGELQRGTTDIMIGLGPTIDRASVSSSGAVMYAIEMTFMTKRPTPSIPWNAFLTPFTLPVWILIVTFAAIVGTLGTVSLVISRSDHPVLSSVTHVYSSLVGQGGLEIPTTSIGTEILFLFWMFGSIVIITYYCSDLLASITIPTADPVPSNFIELASRRDYNLELWYFGGSLSDRYFSAAKTPVYAEMNSRIQRITSGPQCVKTAATKDKHVCISFNSILKSIMAYHLSAAEAQDVVSISDGTHTVYGAMLYQKNSKYQRDFDSIVSHVRGAGLYDRWVKEFFDMRKRQAFARTHQNVTKTFREATDVKAFGLELLVVPFEILAIGLMISLVLFLVFDKALWLYKCEKNLQSEPTLWP